MPLRAVSRYPLYTPRQLSQPHHLGRSCQLQGPRLTYVEVQRASVGMCAVERNWREQTIKSCSRGRRRPKTTI